jgi:hypothetical protein
MPLPLVPVLALPPDEHFPGLDLPTEGLGVGKISSKLYGEPGKEKGAVDLSAAPRSFPDAEGGTKPPDGLYANASMMALKVGLERIPLDTFFGSGS